MTEKTEEKGMEQEPAPITWVREWDNAVALARRHDKVLLIDVEKAH